MPGGQFPGGNMPGGDDSGSGFPGGQFPGGNMPGGQFPGGNMPDMGEFDTENMPDMSDFDMENMPDMGGFSAGGNGGANLNYTGDDLDNYSTIWENEVTKTGKSDHKKVVTALKNISEGNDLETYLDVDNILKYMAVHTFAVNMDSLTGSMAHNYYLYEYDGQLNLLPWDYNLSFGGMSMSANNGATDVVNDAIDTPFSATKFFDALLENEEYLERYHAYLQQLVDEYVNGGRLEEVYNRIRDQIDELVETDPTAFYSYEEYQNAAEILYEVIELRAESISGQLDGTIPSTDAGQRQDQSALIDASHLDITAMGQFDMGGSFSRDEKKEESDGEGTDSSENSSGSNAFGNIPNMGNMPDMSGFDPGNMPDMSGFDPGNMPDMGSFNPGGSSNTKVKTILSYGLCLLLMIAALIAVHFIRRRS
ncbi:MAG: CotH kinase family protein [Firmicutes bacterium]|nr:CotH kinase family protein [Bacillota bacterium]